MGNKKQFLLNKVITLLDSKKFYGKADIIYNSVKIEIPRVFSLIENPEETILKLKQIYSSMMNLNIVNIEFDYSNCEQLGLCASSVTDILVLNALKYRKFKNSKVYTHGNAPKTKEAFDIFFISGLPNHLGIINYQNKNVKKLDIIKNEPQDKMSEKIIEYYNECLLTQHYSLSPEGKNIFGIMIGEVLDNAKNHGGKLSTYYAAGHFNIEEGCEHGKCRLVLFNFGDSIYESLNSDDTTEYTKKQLKEKIKEQTSFFNRKWNAEPLSTLYSLQYNVSSKRKSQHDNRGKGTIKLINSFMQIGQNNEGKKPKMAIISGRCHILFDTTYNLKEEIIDGKKVPIIAFNEENDLSKATDTNYVKKIEEYFPGTMISIEFYLDRKYIESQMEANK